MNFTQILQITQILFSLIPAIVDGIKSVEATGLPGAQKLDMVRTVLQTAYSTEQNVAVSFDAIWPTLQGIVNTIVAGFNASGVFKKS